MHRWKPTEIQAALGRELTEAAVLRGLMELWSALRVIPVYAANEPTRWELTQTRFSDALNAANKIAQTTALSALVSLYLESVLAATPDEVETFLSPLTSRSKVREVVNGLAATRQVSIIPVGTQTMFHVAGSLPEFAEPEPAAAPPEAAPRPRFERPPFAGTSREARGPERRPSFGRDRTGDRPRTGPSRERFAAGGARPGAEQVGAVNARCAGARIPRATIRRGASSSAPIPVGRPAREREAIVLRIANRKAASANPSPKSLSRSGLSTSRPDLTESAAQPGIVRRVGRAAPAPANAHRVESSGRERVVRLSALEAASFRRRSLAQVEAEISAEEIRPQEIRGPEIW